MAAAFDTTDFPPKRSAALARLAAFADGAAADYARLRNFDRAPQAPAAVSGLSPYLRHRAVTEHEVLAAVLARWPLARVEKFVQEVFWRTYWKGWLQARPAVWTDYLQAVPQRLAELDGAGRRPYERACKGATGIDAFDAWVGRLLSTGYLHNHARMWFASIWAHTLRLPWELGADFFLRHLLDGDPASNTLSWRWVVGLHTPGKTYLARADNIAKYTEGRHAPRRLAAAAPVPSAPPLPAPQALSRLSPPPAGEAGLLLTSEDLHAESLPLAPATVAAVALLPPLDGTGPQARAARGREFTAALAADALARVGVHFGASASTLASAEVAALIDWCRAHALRRVLVAEAPVGPTADWLHAAQAPLAAAGIALHPLRRPWDDLAWPHATRGFFGLAAKIPALLAAAGLGRPGAPGLLDQPEAAAP
jgi:deoxyribodipyrimidine photo-lyase